jgi:hypothetical protein
MQRHVVVIEAHGELIQASQVQHLRLEAPT